MKPHQLYQITHIHLDQADVMPQPQVPAQGQYLVFWWKTIPLGDLYIEPGTKLSGAEYYQKRRKAILPALNKYAYAQNRTEVNIPSTSAISSGWEPSALKQFSEAEIPASVPVSVVVCTRNRAKALKSCLTMLTTLRCRPDEILVVDNAPSDDSTREVTAAFEDVIYIKEPRAGLDIARNTGIRKSTNTVIAFTDDDVTVHPLWAYHVWQTFENPKTSAMTGLVIAAELATEAQCIFEKYWSFNRGYTEIIYNSEFFRNTLHKGPPVWKIGAGANMAFRREIFEKVGFFDELLDAGAAGCSGDSEMWYRVLRYGFTIHYNPRAIVFHEHRRELVALKKQIFQYMRGHAAAALTQQKQHKKAGYIRHLAYTFVVAYSRSVLKGFPQYDNKYKTIWVQIAGLLSGVAYYIKYQRKNKINTLN